MSPATGEHPAQAGGRLRLSVVVPCFNEARTLRACLQRLIAIADEELALEIIVVDDCSSDESPAIAREVAALHRSVVVARHPRNRGKGAALQTGFRLATGDIVAIQDADLEYDPRDLKRMVAPIRAGLADVVLGTRFSLTEAHRVLYFWHYLGNRFLTLLSNMFTDLNLSDMECCYKLFRREVIQSLELREARFGIEPELVAKAAQLRCRIYEMGVSYAGRTYADGKKIGVKDGFRALYCIVRYNAFKAPLPLQFLIYLVIGGCAAAVNVAGFLALRGAGVADPIAIPAAFAFAALTNYLLCITCLFRHRVRWSAPGEIGIYLALVGLGAMLDFYTTWGLLQNGASAWAAKAVACGVGLGVNFLGRKYIVFFEPAAGPWSSQPPAARCSEPDRSDPLLPGAGQDEGRFTPLAPQAARHEADPG
ncbi:MAG: bifunctional glycosyltransferase family 2/GtrA family protein [Desulfobacterales bacterium]|nr:bifunctional glycosyltransferase family 2/GtrA family protein [Desulfobacterales bacterium]